MVDIDGLITTVSTRTDEECAPQNLQSMRDLYDQGQGKDPSDEEFIDFAQRIRVDYESLLADMRVEVIGSDIEIPTLPSNCNDESKETL